MRPNKDDFKDKLAGKQDKVAAVESIKKELVDAGLKVKVSRRKLASGVKIYFTVCIPVLLTGPNVARQFSKDIIRHHFPTAVVTSGNATEWTIAEY